MFPDADSYSSRDSTCLNTDRSTGKVSASEGLDCFIALLEGWAAARRSRRSTGACARRSGTTTGRARCHLRFIGPVSPLVVSRFSDIDQDGRADLYDRLLDFQLRAVAEEVRASATPRDPGVPPSQVSGEAADGLSRVGACEVAFAGAPVGPK